MGEKERWLILFFLFLFSVVVVFLSLSTTFIIRLGSTLISIVLIILFTMNFHFFFNLMCFTFFSGAEKGDCTHNELLHHATLFAPLSHFIHV